MNWYLICQDHWTNTTSTTEYTDPYEANLHFHQAQKQLHQHTNILNPDITIQLVGAETLDAVKTRYPHLFTNTPHPTKQQWKTLIHTLNAYNTTEETE